MSKVEQMIIIIFFIHLILLSSNNNNKQIWTILLLKVLNIPTKKINSNQNNQKKQIKKILKIIRIIMWKKRAQTINHSLIVLIIKIKILMFKNYFNDNYKIKMKKKKMN